MVGGGHRQQRPRRRRRGTAAGLPASIVLAHDGGPQPNATLMQQLDRLAGSMTDVGYAFVTTRGLLAARGPEYPRTESR